MATVMTSKDEEMTTPVSVPEAATSTVEAMEVVSDAPTADATPNAVETSEEEYKLIVLNYGKWKDAKSMEQVLRERQVAFRKVQKSRQLSFGFVHFHTQEARDAALPVLQTIEWNGELMDVKTALPKKSMKPVRSNKKRPRTETEEGGAEDKPARQSNDGDEHEASAEGAKEPPKNAREVVTPWADVPYDEQLERKEAEMKKVMIKIVRQTRKEYFKKEKRVANEKRNSKKQKLEASNEDEEGPFSSNAKAFIPTWLTSHGSLYVVADSVLYSRPHEADVSTPWSRIVDAPGVTAIVSFGSELVAATTENIITALKYGPTASYWEKLCDGPSVAIASLASLRGSLLCCTTEGSILKQEGAGRFATGEWKELAVVEGARSITTHNGFLYACCPGETSTPKWQRAPLTADALDTLEFAPYDWSIEVPQMLGMCSHDHQMILLSGHSLAYAAVEGAASVDTRPLSVGTSEAVLTGFASHKGLCCPMDSIHASPVVEGYRNKCEFSIGFDANEKPCVGFRMGLFRDGSVIVSPPKDCVSVSPIMEKVCATVQDLIESSGIPVYDVKTQVGVWRLLTVRHSERTNQLMIMLQVNPKGMSPEEKERLNQLVLEKLTDSSLDYQVTSLFLQEYEGVSAASENDPLVHLHGEKTIEEHLLGMRFSVSPNAFFQVNTRGAETLYSLVKQHAIANEKTLLYDVCCGTGTIGICSSKGTGKVVGIEICKAATDDAVVNAKLNDVTNVSFVNSKAEDVMRDLLKAKPTGEGDAELSRVVAIVDPPRAGLHHQVLRSLRSCPPVERIVYVSCNPTGSLIQDAVTLCGPKTKSITGNAFEPVHAIPVDMFPHTPHCEMIIVFDRVNKTS
ncbi:hypothetical protein Poli38472_013926 [Pythium oligandrum]|uniref:23S rRNA (Uracil-5-)-methyltransferase RumA n=1 Tax=Pythium oligandrum TaxID=41045 RepID=A0A8K1C2A6_PYTOL|nr:hypothetical protein Poli38472_013926 [Pythium oligandrum]|eukprot:TMW55164.1 hypothetical protein Poli38472_013926 [Pythium oligandrum]